MKRLENHVALVTGGGRGIGKAIAARLYAEGAKVAICGTTEGVLRQAADDIGADVLPVVCDVSRAGQVEAMVRMVRERFGKVDILVNNAAVMLRHIGVERAARPFYELAEADWDLVMNVNVKGMWLCSKAVFPDMRYVTSKAAVVGLTRALAFEVGRFGVRVNAVSPGLTQSETVREHDFAEMSEQLARNSAIPGLEYPEDLAGTAAWLASDDAAFVTGQTISVSGGLSFH